MTPKEARDDLRAAIIARGSDLAKASKLLGYNHAYLQQFVNDGKPAYLREQDRERLVELFDIDANALKPPKKLPNRRLEVAGEDSLRPRVGDPIQEPREADIVYTWRQLAEDDKKMVYGMLNGIRAAKGLPPIAA